MFSNREIERSMYVNPEVNCNDYKLFPVVCEKELLVMENIFFSSGEKIGIFPYVSVNSEGIPFVEIYVLDYTLYPFVFNRYIIRQGYCLSADDEQEFLNYIEEMRQEKCYSLISSKSMRSVYDGVNEFFPSWHYINYSPNHICEALCHLYFASHCSGVREILYKSQLNYIAYNIDLVPEHNIIGSSPRTIIEHGLPMNLLRILNQPALVHNLFAEDTIEECRNIYLKYSDYIGREIISSAQWSYLERLYFNNGNMGGQGFNRALFNRLATEWGDDIVSAYENFFEIKGNIPGLRLKLPKPLEIMDVVRKLESVYDYKNHRILENSLIRERAKDSNYEFTSGEYFVKMPVDALDICLEAINQGNCLISYILPHANADTTIVFIRRNSKPNDTYVTMEILEDAINQVYAKRNTLPEKEVYLFLEKYAKEKGLKYDPWGLILRDIDVEDYDDDDMEAAGIDKSLQEYVFDYYRNKIT